MKTGFFLAVLAVAAQAQAAAINLVVVVAQDKGAPKLDGPIAKLVIAPLRTKVSKVTAGPEVAKARAKLKLGPKPLDTQAQQKLAAAVSATSVLVLTVRPDKKDALLQATLTHADGTEAGSWTLPLKAKKLDKKVADQLVASVVEALGLESKASEPEPAPEPTAPTSAPESAAPEPKVEAEAVALATPPEPDAESVPTEVPASPEENPADIEPTPPAAAPAALSEETTTNGRWRPGLRVELGGWFFNREGVIRDAAGTKGPSFDMKDASGKRTLSAGAFARLEAYPLALKALGGHGGILEGLGLELAVRASQMSPQFADGEAIKTNLWNARAGVSFRYALWDSKHATDIAVGAGFIRSGFPLKKGPFPGVVIDSPYAGGRLTLPVPFDIPGLSTLAVLAEGRYLLKPKPPEGLPSLGSFQEASGWEAEAGLRIGLSFLPLELRVAAEKRLVSASFLGQTALRNAAAYTDVTLRDKYLGGHAALALVF